MSLPKRSRVDQACEDSQTGLEVAVHRVVDLLTLYSCFPIAMIKWPSFDNLHRLFTAREKRTMSTIADHYASAGVIVTEKVDGSNLSFVVNHLGVIQICGRTTILWKASDPEDAAEVRDTPPWQKTLKFTGVQFSDFADDAFLRALVNLRAKLVAKETVTIQVYGEAFQRKEGKGVKGCFFPFGVVFNDTDPSVTAANDEDTDVFTGRVLMQTLTLKLHNTFLDVGLNPPKLFFDGPLPLEEAIRQLHEIMLKPQHPGFEGVFITFDAARPMSTNAVLGFKYKTAGFDEQPAWVVEDEMVPESMREAVALMKEVFDQKIALAKAKQSEKKEKAPKELSEAEVQFQRQLGLALSSVMSKRQETFADISSLDKQTWVRVAKEIVDLVTVEVISQFKDADLAVPSDALLKMVTPFVMRSLKSGGPG